MKTFKQRLLEVKKRSATMAQKKEIDSAIEKALISEFGKNWQDDFEGGSTGGIEYEAIPKGQGGPATKAVWVLRQMNWKRTQRRTYFLSKRGGLILQSPIKWERN